MKLLHIFATLFLGFPYLGEALDQVRGTDNFVARRWTTEQGLPQMSVNDIAQGPNGYLWVATFGGLARFDGVKFEQLASSRYRGLPSDRILSLLKTEENSLWVGTEHSGAAIYENGHFQPFKPPDGLGLNGVARIYQGPSGALWIGTAHDLLRIGPDGEFSRFTTADGLAQPPVYTVLEEEDGTVWIGCQEGLAVLRGDRFEEVVRPDSDLTQVRAILRSTTGALYIGASQGLFRLDDNLVFDSVVGTNNRELREVRTLLEDRTGNLWIGLEPEGLFRLTEGRLSDVGIETNLAFGNISALFEGSEATIWGGTSTGGLIQLVRSRFSNVGGPGSGLNHSIVPIVGDGQGGLWLGSGCRGLSHLANGAVTHYGEEDGFANACIWSLLRSVSGTLWIGTLGDGVYRLNNGKFERTGGPNTPEGVVRALFEGSDGNILVGTDSGAFRLDPGTLEFSLIEHTSELNVSFITTGRDGTIWLGTQSGLSVIGADRLDHWDKSNGLASNIVRAIHLDSDGSAWIGTYGGGLYRLLNGRLTHFGTHNGLPEDVVSIILEDEQGRFWLTGNRGVSRVSKSDLVQLADGLAERVDAVLFGTADGMLESECNGGGQPAGLLTDEGMLWVPTINGIASTNTRHDTFNTIPPQVHIERILVDGREIESGGGFTLPPGSRNLEIHYTALSFVAPSRVRFKYRLSGVEESWLDAGNRRVAYFPFLPSGRHQFRLIAGNNDGIWNETGVSLDFSVEPYFFQTPWFIALVALTLAGLITGIVRIRHLSLRRQRRNLRSLVTARTIELEKLAGLSEAINSAMLPEEVLQHVFDSFRPTIPYDRIGFGEITEDGLSLRAQWACSDAKNMEISKGFEAPLVGSSLETILETGEPRIINDLVTYLEQHPGSESTALIVAEGMRSSLTCPLKAGDNNLGFIFFSSRQPSTFTNLHVSFFKQIAGQLSHAIEKSRLYSDLLETRKNLEKANRALEAQASQDGLTGLANRRVLDIKLDDEWRRCARSKKPLSLIMIDIDHFKLFNDTYGHIAGDDCLKRVAVELNHSFRRSGECVARYGGEEFAVVLPEINAEDSLNAATRFLENLAELKIHHETSPVKPWVTASIGIATTHPESSGSLTELILQADRALYKAKRNGRNCCVQARIIQDA